VDLTRRADGSVDERVHRDGSSEPK
jgi:hypothetical protein